MAGAPAIYLAIVPVTSIIAKEGGIFQSILGTMTQAIPGLGSVQPDRVIPAMSAFYIFATFVGSSAGSVAGSAASREKGLDPYRKRPSPSPFSKFIADNMDDLQTHASTSLPFAVSLSGSEALTTT